MNEPWYTRIPALVDEITSDLRVHYPNLHLSIDDEQGAEIRGTLPVISPQGKVLDRYQITIRLLPDYPKSLPEVREVGGRIPWDPDYHIERDGTACVLMPDDRWRCFPEAAPFREYLDGPLHDFFLGQSLVALGEDWPFGGWSHGADGIYEFYQDLLGTSDRRTIKRFLHVLNKLHFKSHLDCPCGSGKKIRKCCQEKVSDLRRKIPPAIARKASERLGLIRMPLRRSR
ncbi:MAG: hypothetical protein O7D91_21205 [Planctomycetota bacterium]|nr:hypothetical protein [Planctomycetota bacterium]